MPLASLTTTLTNAVAHHGIVAVFALMAIDALLPGGGELVMLLAGALAGGAIGHGLTGVGTGAPAYLVLSGAGTLGYAAGAVVGWAIGRRGGRELLARHGRWLHLGPDRLRRAEVWFDRHGPAAVLLGRLTPLVRSFVSVPAGVLGAPFPSYVVLTLVGSAIWCFGFAGAGWALGASWHTVHGAFGYVDAAVAAAVVAVVAWLLLRGRSRGASRGEHDGTRERVGEQRDKGQDDALGGELAQGQVARSQPDAGGA
jgi:membrane protein DedA with SNARE-associated domain